MGDAVAATERAFLERIGDAPDDDAPRLVYADWLLEQGGEAALRGEYVRLQCALARLDASLARLEGAGRAEAAAERARIAERAGVLAGVYRMWEARLAGQHDGVLHEDRGVPTRFFGFAYNFACDAAALLERVPSLSIVDLTATGPLDETLATLARIPALARVQRLSVQGDHGYGEWRAGEAGARALAASPHLARLTSLRMPINRVGDAGALALVDAEGLGSLTTLDLSWNRIGSAGAQRLAASPGLARLRALELDGNAIGVRGAQALAASPHVASLRELGLSKCNIGDHGAQALAASPHLAALASLDVHECRLGEAARGALRERFGVRVAL